MLRRLEASGPAESAALVSIRALELEWTQLLRAPGMEGTSLTAWRCYQGGCTAALSSKDPDALERVANTLQVSDAMLRISGQSFRSGPIVNASGATEMTWIVGTRSAVASTARESPDFF